MHSGMSRHCGYDEIPIYRKLMEIVIMLLNIVQIGQSRYLSICTSPGLPNGTNSFAVEPVVF